MTVYSHQTHSLGYKYIKMCLWLSPSHKHILGVFRGKHVCGLQMFSPAGRELTALPQNPQLDLGGKCSTLLGELTPLPKAFSWISGATSRQKKEGKTKGGEKERTNRMEKTPPK